MLYLDGDRILNTSLNNYTYLSLNCLEFLIKLVLNKGNKDKYKVAQAVLSSKKKTRLTTLNMHFKVGNNLESALE